ncbi:MAG: carbohydrate ABC transporter permease [Spirochaetes bacterium]|uniref:Carbohydrate ABC transporter permease n=1 Tax=Candidatus Ornithospirochaeta stercoravium TaxID=2840897 RepID=A0A9D9NEA6_9SPIO|nr:carbohydrate ABC transporter permease [Candidatus Ornithospirochaeta stercoravium]
MIADSKKRTTISSSLRMLFLVLIAFTIAVPYIWMILSSFREGQDIFVKGSWIPDTWRWQNYPEAMEMAPFGRFFINSIITSLLTVMAQLITCPMAAFAFAKLNFRSKNILFTIFLCTMMVPSESTIIANYLTMASFHLTNTYFAIIAPSLTSMFAIFLLRQFFMTIPDALIDAARIDGAGTFQIFTRILLPLAGSAIATIVIFGFVGSWNAYLWPTLVTSDTEMRTVQTGLRYMVDPDLGSEWPKILAASTVIILPVMALFVSLQKYFVQGITKVGLK